MLFHTLSFFLQSEVSKDAVNWADRAFYAVIGLLTSLIVIYAKNYFQRLQTISAVKNTDTATKKLEKDMVDDAMDRLDRWVTKYELLAGKISELDYRYDMCFRALNNNIHDVIDFFGYLQPLLENTGQNDLLKRMLTIHRKIETVLETERGRHDNSIHVSKVE